MKKPFVASTLLSTSTREGLEKRLARRLSSGQQQRAALATIIGARFRTVEGT